jgi:alpha-tubulin suppressor-like RCC1 family protein
MMLSLLLASMFGHSMGKNPPLSSVTAGKQFSFIVNGGNVRAAGKNKYGQLGLDDESEAEVNLTLVDLEESVKMVAVGAFHSLFLTPAGSVYVVGRNNYGQLGGPNEMLVREPTMVLNKTVNAVAAGYAHSLFLMKDGSVLASGRNNAGQLGDGTSTSRNKPEPVQGLPGNVTAIAAGYDFSYFLLEDGAVFATGQNLGGQLGDGSFQTRYRPVSVIQIEPARKVQGIAAGESHGLFLTDDGNVFGTGATAFGQIGNSVADSKPINKPQCLFSECDGKNDVLQVFAGGDSSLIVDGAGKEGLVLGSNHDGKIGAGEAVKVLVPKKVTAGVLTASIGVAHAYIVKEDGSVLATGDNQYGELGDGTQSAKNEFEKVGDVLVPEPIAPVPTPVPTPSPPRDQFSAAPDGILFTVGTIALILVIGMSLCLRPAEHAVVAGAAEMAIRPERSV